LFAVIRCLKKELVFHCHRLYDIFDSDDVDTVMSHSEMNIFILLGEISVFFTSIYVISSFTFIGKVDFVFIQVVT